VSVSVNRRSFHSVWVDKASRVVPATGATMERLLPVMRLKRVDLPTFGRPTRTTVGPPVLVLTAGECIPNGLECPHT